MKIVFLVQKYKDICLSMYNILILISLLCSFSLDEIILVCKLYIILQKLDFVLYLFLSSFNLNLL